MDAKAHIQMLIELAPRYAELYKRWESDDCSEEDRDAFESFGRKVEALLGGGHRNDRGDACVSGCYEDALYVRERMDRASEDYCTECVAFADEWDRHQSELACYDWPL